MTGRFEGRVAFVTGAGTGIGAAIARRLASEGSAVILVGRRPEPLQAVAAELGDAATVMALDCASASDMTRAMEETSARFGRLDIVVANAGGAGASAAADTSDEEWAAALRANLHTAFVTARATLPQLTVRGGVIVIVSSMAGAVAVPGLVGYTSAKHALVGLTRSIAVDYGRAGVRAMCVCPGWVRTDMADAEMTRLSERLELPSVESAYEFATRHLPLARAATADEVASVVAFVASSDAAMMTGSTVYVDGGASAVDVGTLAFGIAGDVTSPDR